eukprot:TRINITY_DN9304_c0_g1_i2.p1 TRINITY_DN9304_c0_g1~~TRINITY_DN9304_c0_g1_i2.p1  ORF type:complete len:815 (+),score=258.26 TRINITY_DN9304_c0_g1_i2:82-2445(+)
MSTAARGPPRLLTSPAVAGRGPPQPAPACGVLYGQPPPPPALPSSAGRIAPAAPLPSAVPPTRASASTAAGRPYASAPGASSRGSTMPPSAASTAAGGSSGSGSSGPCGGYWGARPLQPPVPPLPTGAQGLPQRSPSPPSPAAVPPPAPPGAPGYRSGGSVSPEAPAHAAPVLAAPPVPGAPAQGGSGADSDPGFHEVRARLAQLHADRAAAQLAAAEAEGLEHSLRCRLARDQEQAEETIGRLVNVVVMLRGRQGCGWDSAGSLSGEEQMAAAGLDPDLAAAEGRCAVLRGEVEDMRIRIREAEDALGAERGRVAGLRAEQERLHRSVHNQAGHVRDLEERHEALGAAHLLHVAKLEGETLELREQVTAVEAELDAARRGVETAGAAAPQREDCFTEEELAAQQQQQQQQAPGGGAEPPPSDSDPGYGSGGPGGYSSGGGTKRPTREWPPSPRRARADGEPPKGQQRQPAARRREWPPSPRRQREDPAPRDPESPSSPDAPFPGGPSPVSPATPAQTNPGSGGESSESCPRAVLPGTAAERFGGRRSVGFAGDPAAPQARAPAASPTTPVELTPTDDRRARAAFERVDALCSKDGSISKKELTRLLREDRLAAKVLFNELDTNTSGEVDMDEWIALFTRLERNGQSASGMLEWLEGRLEELAGGTVRFTGGGGHGHRARGGTTTRLAAREGSLTPEVRQRATAAFSRVDALCQKDGSVSLAELCKVLEQEPLAAKILFAELDADASGNVTLSEWTGWFARTQGSKGADAVHGMLDWIEERLDAVGG